MDAKQINTALSSYLSAAQAAAKLKISKRAAIYAAERGQLDGSILIAGRWFIPPQAVAARTKQHGRGPIPQASRRKRQPKAKPDNDLR